MKQILIIVGGISMSFGYDTSKSMNDMICDSINDEYSCESNKMCEWYNDGCITSNDKNFGYLGGKNKGFNIDDIPYVPEHFKKITPDINGYSPPFGKSGDFDDFNYNNKPNLIDGNIKPDITPHERLMDGFFKSNRFYGKVFNKYGNDHGIDNGIDSDNFGYGYGLGYQKNYPIHGVLSNDFKPGFNGFKNKPSFIGRKHEHGLDNTKHYERYGKPKGSSSYNDDDKQYLGDKVGFGSDLSDLNYGSKNFGFKRDDDKPSILY